MDKRIVLVSDDITRMACDAIVNAANKSLLGGGGVDGAIHRAAGKQLLEACRELNGCETGQAKITAGYHLPAKHVIHTVGPVWRNGSSGEKDLLKSCYQKSLELAVENEIKSIAFPNISTGIYHFPKKLAAQIAVQTVDHFLSQNSSLLQVYFVCFDKENFELYQNLLSGFGN